MRNRIIASLTCALALSAAVFAGDAAADLKKQVQTAFAGFTKAFKNKDADGAEKLMRGFFSKDFSSTNSEGKKMTLNEMIALERQHIAGIKTVTSMNLDLRNIKASGNKGSGSETFNIQATIIDPMDAKKTAKLKVESKANSMYKKVGGKWWCTSSKITSEKVWINGKLMGPGM
ncbi:MAG: hypothetical protein WAO58_10445 [Fimbriimonadaceae bacterium]